MYFVIHTLFSFTIGIQREEDKVKRSMKEAAKKGNKDVCIILAKEILRSRKTINKLITSKTHMNSIQMQMKNQLCKLVKFIPIAGDRYDCTRLCSF